MSASDFFAVLQIYDRAAVYMVKHGQIYKPDVFDGKFAPLMPTMQMKTYGYCTSGFGMQDGHVDKDFKVAYQCCEKHEICKHSISVYKYFLSRNMIPYTVASLLSERS